MKIPADILSEKNYEGSRLILVENEKVAELQKELTKLQLEANPWQTQSGTFYGPRE